MRNTQSLRLKLPGMKYRHAIRVPWDGAAMAVSMKIGGSTLKNVEVITDAKNIEVKLFT